jgi:hypothetical protein
VRTTLLRAALRAFERTRFMAEAVLANLESSQDFNDPGLDFT